MTTDTLSRLLTTLDVPVSAFALLEIETGWRLRFDAMDAVTIHYVLAGAGVVEVSNSEPASFATGDLIVMPARRAFSFGEPGAPAHKISATPGIASLIEAGLVRFTAGDGSRDVLITCGMITASYGGALGLFDGLGAPVIEPLAGDGFVEPAHRMLLDELTNPSLGTQVLTETAMKQCLVFVLRRHMSREGTRSPLFAALADSRLARALTEVMERPAAPHSLESLSTVAGMSRSSFAAAFSAQYGRSAMAFVRDVRLQRAARLLATTDLPVKIIAASVGYGSRSYFSSAFRNAFGVDPTKYRALGGRAE